MLGPISPQSLQTARQTGINQNLESKIDSVALKLLQNANGQNAPLKPNQKLIIKGSSDLLPLVHRIHELAYKNFQSGKVSLDLVEPQIEKLKTRFPIQSFESKKNTLQKIKQEGGAEIEISDAETAKTFSAEELKNLKASIAAKLDPVTQRQIDEAISVDDLIDFCISLDSALETNDENQPLYITTPREAMPSVVRLLEKVFTDKPGARTIGFNILEAAQFDPLKPIVKYASEQVRSERPEAVIDSAKEVLAKKTARIFFDGDDPNKFGDLTATEQKRLAEIRAIRGKAMRAYQSKLSAENPWCAYYHPTTASAKAAGYQSLSEAAIEAKKINRVGRLKEHGESLTRITDKLNSLAKQGYRTLKYKTSLGTDFSISITPHSHITSVGEMSTVRPEGKNQKYMPNVPSEEAFTTPDARTTNGAIYTTRPTELNGQNVSGIRFEFKNGELVSAKAQERDDVLQAWLSNGENLDKVGEISAVADSPIFDLDRTHGNILIDENATCHFALGRGYDFAIRQIDGLSGSEREKYLMEELGCNMSASDHRDFMFGDESIKVSLSKDDGASVEIIKANKFVI